MTLHRRGFTLIELLVVVMIVAILAAILFPVFARARASAHQIACMSNARQIAFAVQMYARDNKDQFPWVAKYGRHWSWMDQLVKYVRIENKIYKCPSATRSALGVPLMETINGRTYTYPYANYGMNNYLVYPWMFCPTHPEAKTMNGLPFASRTALIADSAANGTFNDWADKNEMYEGYPLGINRVRCANTQDMFYVYPPHYEKRHPSGTYVVFADAHVSFVAHDKWVWIDANPKVEWPLINPYAIPAPGP